ncbi:unnamed protein product [Cunninghamella blakesleeana]
MQKLPPQPEYIFRGHQAEVNSCCFFDDDKYIASGDAEGNLIVWYFETRRPILQWKGHTESILSVNVYDKNKLISQGRDHKIHIWQLDMTLSLKEIPKIIDTVDYYALNYCKLSMCTLKDHTLICLPAKGDTPLLDVFSLTKKEWVIQNIGSDQDNEKRRLCMAVQMCVLNESEDQLGILGGYENGEIAFWRIDISTNQFKFLWNAQEHQQPILDLSIFQDKAYSTCIDDQIVKYNLDEGSVVKKVRAKKPGIACIKVRNDNKIFMTSGYDGRIRIYSVKTMNPLAVLTYHRDSVYCVSFASALEMKQKGENDDNKHWLIGGGKDGRISLWQLY